MAYWAWILFLYNEFFILIILLNFLIAIISQSYDEVMSREEVELYNSRCYLNFDISFLVDLLEHFKLRKKRPARIFYIIAKQTKEQDENDYVGFVRTIKNSVKRQNALLKEDIK